MSAMAIANINMNNAIGSMVAPDLKEDLSDLQNLGALDDDDKDVLRGFKKWGKPKFDKFSNLYKKMAEWNSRKIGAWRQQFLADQWMASSGFNSTSGSSGTWITAGTSSSTTTIYPSSGALSSNTYTGANVYVAGTGGALVQVSAGDLDSFQDIGAVLKLHPGTERIVELPDGSKIYVDKDGNYKIDDKDSKVVHKASNIKEFNRYMNASDLIEEFIKDVGKLGITQGQLLKLPINAFFVWLVFKAAEADGEQPPTDVPKLEHLPEVKQSFLQPKCKCCGKFITKQVFALGVNFCSSEHMQYYMDRHLAVKA